MPAAPESDPLPTGASLLDPDEPSAVEVVNLDGRSRVMLVCDHAASRVPRCLGSLGLDPRRLTEHIGWDPGAAAVARHLSTDLDATLVLSGYSRLVIDCNRPLRSEESIPEASDGVPIPGNRGLSREEREARVAALFRPYHETIARLLGGRPGRASLLLSIHSFAPVLAGHERPWHIGIASGRERRLASPLLTALAGSSERFTVGDNEPYAIEEDIDYTIPLHGEGRGLPCAMIEIRQDGIRTEAGARVWAGRIAEGVRQIEGASPP
jgi:predicted N-formylglutamate amidohydrolase